MTQPDTQSARRSNARDKSPAENECRSPKWFIAKENNLMGGASWGGSKTPRNLRNGRSKVKGLQMSNLKGGGDLVHSSPEGAEMPQGLLPKTSANKGHRKKLNGKTGSTVRRWSSKEKKNQRSN